MGLGEGALGIVRALVDAELQVAIGVRDSLVSGPPPHSPSKVLGFAKAEEASFWRGVREMGVMRSS